ncbi:MAG: hypothetical protein RLZZ611_2534 [Cyanobacteriota bacterium]|jgi:tetrahydromethanopterin S-methyltransferase subunit F
MQNCDDAPVQKHSHSVARYRAICAEACNALLGLFLIGAIILQARDYAKASEVVPASSFAVMLSLASFAVSWARINPPNATEGEQRRVKRIGLDMLMGSILTLISSGLLLMSTDSAIKSTIMSPVMIALHIGFLAAGLLMGWLALSRMLRESVRVATTA